MAGPSAAIRNAEDRLNARPSAIPWLLGGLVLCLLATAACSGANRDESPEAQLRFGVEMAKQGLWQEALFRFEKANRLDPKNPKILNNLAVAQEANGRFDAALETYREALAIAPGSRDLKDNYARFVDFYQSYSPSSATGLPGLGDTKKTPDGEGATP